jgi:hypothetical protein
VREDSDSTAVSPRLWMEGDINLASVVLGIRIWFSGFGGSGSGSLVLGDPDLVLWFWGIRMLFTSFEGSGSGSLV